jgi:hypothetical protein
MATAAGTAAAIITIAKHNCRQSQPPRTHSRPGMHVAAYDACTVGGWHNGCHDAGVCCAGGGRLPLLLKITDGHAELGLPPNTAVPANTARASRSR